MQKAEAYSPNSLLVPNPCLLEDLEVLFFFFVVLPWSTSQCRPCGCVVLSICCRSNLSVSPMNRAVAFMLALGGTFTVSLTGSRVFGPGMPVFWREASPGVGMGLSKSAFFVAKCAVEVPRLAVLRCLTLCTGLLHALSKSACASVGAFRCFAWRTRVWVCARSAGGNLRRGGVVGGRGAWPTQRVRSGASSTSFHCARPLRILKRCCISKSAPP